MTVAMVLVVTVVVFVDVVVGLCGCGRMIVGVCSAGPFRKEDSYIQDDIKVCQEIFRSKRNNSKGQC